MTRTLRDAVDERKAVATRDGGEGKTIEAVKNQVRQNRAWFKTVVPRHIDAEQFVALCLGAISKGDNYLKLALAQAPHTFLQAASECARMGLVPGETYHFVAFRNTRKDPETGHETRVYEVTGIVDYRGEIDMIYRAGGVTAVHCHVVRANDGFRWRPGDMDVPYHVIHAPEGSHQEGLAPVEERGHITGVYAYCTMAGGGYSQPVVMGLSEIKRHRSFAKTEKFWGPVTGLYDVSLEGKNTVDMVRKTAIHKLFDVVPHSSEYMAERMRVASVMEQAPVPVVQGRTEDHPALEAAADAPPEDRDEEDNASDEARRVALNSLMLLFQRYGLGAKNLTDTRRAIVTGLLAADYLVTIEDLDPEVLMRARDQLFQQFNDINTQDHQACQKALKEYASKAAAERMK